MPEVVVFLGPSLRREDAERILSADYRPPAARGDIPQAVADGARVIGLIDGVFFQECSVGHREILAALRQGVKVVGASSMGALRASELDGLGMEGVGEVYRRYRSGEIVADDEVALVYDPESGLSLSEPLVNVRYAVEMAEAEGIISHESGCAIIAAAEKMYYPDRTYARICAQAGEAAGHGPVGDFFAFVRSRRPDIKREDTLLALSRIAELARDPGIGPQIVDQGPS